MKPDEVKVIDPKTEERTREPDMYQVVILNDDFTPMDFVVEVLMKFFGFSTEKAVLVMLNVHHQGKGICGVYTRDVAETKAQDVCDYARENEHPLKCVAEKVD